MTININEYYTTYANKLKFINDNYDAYLKMSEYVIGTPKKEHELIQGLYESFLRDFITNCFDNPSLYKDMNFYDILYTPGVENKPITESYLNALYISLQRDKDLYYVKAIINKSNLFGQIMSKCHYDNNNICKAYKGYYISQDSLKELNEVLTIINNDIEGEYFTVTNQKNDITKITFNKTAVKLIENFNNSYMTIALKCVGF